MPAARFDRGDEVILARGWQHGKDALHGILGKKTGEAAILLLDEASGRNRCRFVDPSESERFRVANGDVAAGSDQHDGMVRRRLIQFLTIGMPCGVELGLIVAARHNPFARGQHFGTPADGIEQPRECRRNGGPYVDPHRIPAERDQVEMAVVEARRREPAVEVDHLCRRADQIIDIGRRTSGQDASLPDGDRFGLRGVASAPDHTVVQDEIGGDAGHGFGLRTDVTAKPILRSARRHSKPAPARLFVLQERGRRSLYDAAVEGLRAERGATHFLMKTLPRVTGEMALHVLAYNLTRVMNIMGVKSLLAVMRV